VLLLLLLLSLPLLLLLLLLLSLPPLRLKRLRAGTVRAHCFRCGVVATAGGCVP
jgi:hypothetical protein